MLGTQDLLTDCQQGGELVARPGGISRKCGPVGEPVPGSQGIRMFRTEDPLSDR